MDEAKVWRQYQSDRTTDNRNAVIDFYWQRIAGRINKALRQRKCQHLKGEVLSAVAERIISAVPRCRGAVSKKRNYLFYHVDGAVLDALRTLDRKPRIAREENNEIEEARIQLSHQLGRRPNDYDLAEYLGIPEEDIVRSHQAEHERTSISLDSQHMQIIARDDEAIRENAAICRDMIEALPQKMRTIANLYFEGNMTTGQIATKIGQSQSTITRTILEIRKIFRKNMNNF